MTVAASEAYNTAFEARLTGALGVTFTARPDTAGGREPVREITGVPFGMIEFFSRRRAAIEARYAELVRDYRAEHGHDPAAGAAHQLARQANLDTRQGKKPPRSLAGKRAAWREELTGAVRPRRRRPADDGRPPVPRLRSAAELPSAADLDDLAERAVAAVAARRSTWTAWNIRAEAERLLRTEVPVPAAGTAPRARRRDHRARRLPRVLDLGRGPGAARRARRAAPRRRGVGVHRARRRPVHQPGRP